MCRRPFQSFQLGVAKSASTRPRKVDCMENGGNSAGRSGLGIEIGGTKLQIVAGDGAARIIERRRLPVDRAKGAAGIREQIKAALGELIPATKPDAVGVGFGGPVDWK